MSRKILPESPAFGGGNVPFSVADSSIRIEDVESSVSIPRQKLKRKRRNIIIGSLAGAWIFAVALAIVIVLRNARVQSLEATLTSGFSANAEMQIDHIERTLQSVGTNLRLTSKAVTMLPYNASMTRMYPILATAAGLMNDVGELTATPPYGPMSFLQHLMPPYTEERISQLAEERGVDLTTYRPLSIAQSDVGSQQVKALNMSAPHIYMVTHSSNLPPTYSQAQLQASGIFLTDFYQSRTNGIETAVKENRMTSGKPFFVPAGYTAISVAAPVYFNEWSNDDPIASETDYRGVVVQTVWNVSLVRAVDLGFPVWFQLRDIEMSEPFITSRSDAVPIRDVEVDSEPLRAVRRISAFSRTYEVEVFPTEASLRGFDEAFHHPWTFYFGIVAGVVISIALGCVVYVLLRRASSKRSMAELKEALSSEKKLAEAEGRIHEQVLGYVHHEVRNPLNIVMGTVELLLTALHENHTSPQRALTAFTASSRRALTSKLSSKAGGLSTIESDPSEVEVLQTVATSEVGGAAPPEIRRRAEVPAVCLPSRVYGELVEELHLLRAAGLQIEQHINDMLDLQRLRHRELVLNPLPCDIVACLQSIINFYRPQSRVPIFLDGSAISQGIVVVDELRVRQVVTNALLNAIAHTSRGSITVKAEVRKGKAAMSELFSVRRKGRAQASTPAMNDVVFFGATANPKKMKKFKKKAKGNGPYGLSHSPHGFAEHSLDPPSSTGSDPECDRAALKLTIRDTGCGLGGANVEDLFKSFMSKKRVMGGDMVSNAHSSGLGLSICGLLGESMGGGADLRDLGTGCEFVFVVPVELRDYRDIFGAGPSSQSAGRLSGNEQKNTRTSDSVVSLAMPGAGPTQQSDRAGSTEGVPRHDHPEPGRDTDSKLEPPSDACNPPLSMPSSPVSARRALVIDDDPTNVKLVSRMLKLQGVQSHGISTGNIPEMVEEALRRAGHLDSPPESGVEPFNFVLLDIRLGPTLSGVDILRELKPRLRGGLPVFAMTANTRDSDVLEYKSTGFSGLIAKPVSRMKVSGLLSFVTDMHMKWLEEQSLSTTFWTPTPGE